MNSIRAPLVHAGEETTITATKTLSLRTYHVGISGRTSVRSSIPEDTVFKRSRSIGNSGLTIVIRSRFPGDLETAEDSPSLTNVTPPNLEFRIPPFCSARAERWKKPNAF
jgi:hypothetical protein